MTDAEIVDLAEQCRDRQRRWFAARRESPHADLSDLLALCRDYERRLDRAIAERKKRLAAAERPGLFGSPQE